VRIPEGIPTHCQPTKALDYHPQGYASLDTDREDAFDEAIGGESQADAGNNEKGRRSTISSAATTAIALMPHLDAPSWRTFHPAPQSRQMSAQLEEQAG
jgi:hypothetical protein